MLVVIFIVELEYRVLVSPTNNTIYDIINSKNFRISRKPWINISWEYLMLLYLVILKLYSCFNASLNWCIWNIRLYVFVTHWDAIINSALIIFHYYSLTCSKDETKIRHFIEAVNHTGQYKYVPSQCKGKLTSFLSFSKLYNHSYII